MRSIFNSNSGFLCYVNSKTPLSFPALLLLIGCSLLPYTSSRAAASPFRAIGHKGYVLTSDGVKLFVKSAENEHPVCFFVHGGPGAWSRSFEDLHGNQLEKIFNMVYYDQRGCGRSDTALNYSLARMVKDIDEIRISLHQEKIYLIAHSFGGIIATAYAKAFPAHLSGLILMNCTLDVNASLNYQLNYISQLTGKKYRKPIAGDLLQIYSAARKDLDSVGLGYKLFSDNKMAVESLDSIDSKKPANTGFANAAWTLPEYFNDYGKISRQINTPVLVISGVKDYCVGPDHYRRFRFPNKKICRIDGGHILYYEKTDELIYAIEHWL